MLRALYHPGYHVEGAHMLNHTDRSAIWIDLHEPTAEEEKIIETSCGIAFPNRAKVQEIEQSSQLYQENGALYMTATIPIDHAHAQVEIQPVTFILTHHTLITVRHASITLFDTLIDKPQRLGLLDKVDDVQSLSTLLQRFLDAIVGSIADLLEKSMAEIESLSKELFHHADIAKGILKKRRRDFSKILFRLGVQGGSIAVLRDALTSITRLIGFANKQAEKKLFGIEDVLLATVERDVHCLSDHALFMSNKVAFLLEATLGLVNIEQNMMIKMFSVASLIFLPPTLLASIWGMNYRCMPELMLPWGYPTALFCMFLSSIIPYSYFKRKGWL